VEKGNQAVSDEINWRRLCIAGVEAIFDGNNKLAHAWAMGVLAALKAEPSAPSLLPVYPSLLPGAAVPIPPNAVSLAPLVGEIVETRLTGETVAGEEVELSPLAAAILDVARRQPEEEPECIEEPEQSVDARAEPEELPDVAEIKRAYRCPCGETDPDAFSPSSTYRCRRCANDYQARRRSELGMNDPLSLSGGAKKSAIMRRCRDIYRERGAVTTAVLEEMAEHYNVLPYKVREWMMEALKNEPIAALKDVRTGTSGTEDEEEDEGE